MEFERLKMNGEEDITYIFLQVDEIVDIIKGLGEKGEE